MVPRHVREDIRWMVDHQVDGVFVGVHDSDLLGGNTAMVCDIIREEGLDVWLIPSRIGGLMAGWGRQPSYLSACHPEWWAKNADGSFRNNFGPQVSLFHHQVPHEVAKTVYRMLEEFPATGIVWDELKTLQGEDHSSAAFEYLGRAATSEDMLQATVECFSQVNQMLKEELPELLISCFLYADSPQAHVDACAEIEGLDEFGCDGKCFPPGASHVGEGGGEKVLLGGNNDRFASAAAGAGRRPFTLLETQLLDEPTLDLSLEHLPAFLDEKQGHLAFYYYPYGLADPEKYMPLVGKQVAAWRQKG